MKAQIQALTDAIRKHDHEYYVLNNPSIPDSYYDAMFAKLVCLEAEHPELADPNSPTSRIGSDITNNFRRYPHIIPMLSVKSFYSDTEIANELPEVDEFCIEDKIDGLAIEIEYRHGQLFRALTRGDGQSGEDVTEKIRTIKSIPLTIPGYQSITVRGEIIITTKGLHEVNRLRRSQKLQPFPNQRNAAASLVMSQKSGDLAPYAYALEAYMFDCHLPDSQFEDENLRYMSNLGFRIPNYTFIKRSDLISNLSYFIKQFRFRSDNIHKHSYPIDGIVIKVNNHNDRKRLGQNKRNVNWAWALKEKSEELTSRFHFIDYSIAANGTITPVIHFAPVTHKGITYKSARVSWSTLSDLSLTLLCQIHFVVAGGVSAQITGASANNANQAPFNFVIAPISACPCCKQPLEVGNNTRRCKNLSCPEKTDNFEPVATGLKVFQSGQNFGTIAQMRFAASFTPAIVARKAKGAATPVLLYQSVNHLAQTMQILGLIGKFA